tara:strand:+ start:1216 stop:1869 length:654 start_codon:yes stop_codon:yes gene_type:complete
MVKNVLAIGAHPDDIEFGCFGTLKKHINEGDNVTMLVMTHSDVIDTHTRNVVRDSSISRQEASASAKVLGAKLLLGPFQDTKVPFNSDSVGFIENVIRENNINWIYTHWAGDTHQDHINTLNATMASSRLVKNVLCYEQVPLPRISSVQPNINYYVDISSTINIKIQGCKVHHHQISKFTQYGFDMIENVKSLAKFRGSQCGVKYAEAFNILKIVNI